MAVEKTPTTSKKFMAAMRFTRDWTVVIVITLGAVGAAAAGLDDKALAAGLTSVLIAEIVVLGFVQVLYLGGQAAVDTFVRMAVVIITGRAGASVPAPSPEPVPSEPESA